MFWNRVLSINLYLAWENFIFPTKFSTKKFSSKYHLTCALELFSSTSILFVVWYDLKKTNNDHGGERNIFKFSINLIPCITSFNVIFAINSWYYIRINILNLYQYNCAMPKWIDVEFPHIAVKILGFVSRIPQIILNLKEKIHICTKKPIYWWTLRLRCEYHYSIHTLSNLTVQVICLKSPWRWANDKY